MDKKQFTNLVLIPTLKEIPKGYSDEAVMAIEMIIAHEARRGHYLKQVRGPAMGLINMEPATYVSTWHNGDSIWQNAKKLGIITIHEYEDRTIPDINRLLWDLRFNVFMARQRLFMKRGALPKLPVDMTLYLKKHWNSTDGAAHPNVYFTDWIFWK